MKPSIQTLGQILFSPSQYVVPVFQRTYRWELPQWTAFWESLIEIQQPDKVGNHFMGFLVFVPGLAQPGQYTRFHLIDGQQRLTTASLLLIALRNAAREAGEEDLAHEINDYYLVHPLKKGNQRYRLLPKGGDYERYIALVDNKSRPAGRMAGAVTYFEEQLATFDADSPDFLRDIFNTVCQRFEFMCATLEAENAYNIFKSLNSTGVPLGPADLIRNFIFMHVLPDEQDEFDEQLWRPLEHGFSKADGTLNEEAFSHFFRDYLMSFGRYVPPKETFANFEARYEATDFSPHELARDLLAASEQYAVISSHKADMSDKVTTALAALNRLESSTTYPLLLAFFRRRGQGDIDDDQLARAVAMLTGFILRRFVTGESSRGYSQIFVRALGEDEDDPIATLETYLTERGWPDDRRFISAFVEFPLYQRGYTRVILEALERAHGHKEPADLAKAQIEHIMPQTLNDAWRKMLGEDADRVHADWLHRPGNLTLSGYNPELLNHPFPLKREYYKNSNIVMTRTLAEYSQWTEAEIQARGQALAELAAKLWIGSTVGPSDNQIPDRGKFYLEFWTQFLAYTKQHGKHIKRDKLSGRYFITFGLGRKGFWLEGLLYNRRNYIAAGLGFRDSGDKPFYHLLKSQQAQIEQEMGIDCTWYEQPTKNSCYITAYWRDINLLDRERWPEYNAWFLDTLERFYVSFAPRVKALDPADWVTEQ